MEFRTLHYFLTVAQERNITRAAEQLHMAQPPLTLPIQRPDDELRVPLPIRGGRHHQLSDEGRLLQARRRDVLIPEDITSQKLGPM